MICAPSPVRETHAQKGPARRARGGNRKREQKKGQNGMALSQGTQVVFTNRLTALVPRLLPGSISRFADSVMSRTKPKTQRFRVSVSIVHVFIYRISSPRISHNL